MKKCPVCGDCVEDDDEYCFGCGSNLQNPPEGSGRGGGSANGHSGIPGELTFEFEPTDPSVLEAEAMARANNQCPECGAPIKPDDEVCDACGLVL